MPFDKLGIVHKYFPHYHYDQDDEDFMRSLHKHTKAVGKYFTRMDFLTDKYIYYSNGQ